MHTNILLPTMINLIQHHYVLKRPGVSDAKAARQVEGEQLQCWQNGSNLIYAKAKQGLD